MIRLAVLLRPTETVERRVGDILVHPQHVGDEQRTGRGGQAEMLRHGSARPPGGDAMGQTLSPTLVA